MTPSVVRKVQRKNNRRMAALAPKDAGRSYLRHLRAGKGSSWYHPSLRKNFSGILKSLPKNLR